MKFGGGTTLGIRSLTPAIKVVSVDQPFNLRGSSGENIKIPQQAVRTSIGQLTFQETSR